MKNMLKEPYDCWQNERYYEHVGLMDHESAKYLLITLKNVLQKHGVTAMPMFGTLLGAIREHDFIKNDTDIDMVIYAKDKDAVLALRPELEKYDIHLYCYVLPWIFTFEYKGITCDLYPLYESVWPWTNHYYLLLEKYISRSFFDMTEDYELFDETFKVPAHPENILAYLYGKTWHIPQSTKPKIESRFFFWRYAHRFVQRCNNYAKRHWFTMKTK
jgi:hypothetical protein